MFLKNSYHIFSNLSLICKIDWAGTSINFILFFQSPTFFRHFFFTFICWQFLRKFWPIPLKIAFIFYGRPLFGILLMTFFVQADGFVNFSQNFCSDMGGVLGKNWTLSQTNWHTPDMLSVADWLDYYRINQRISSTFPPWVCFMLVLI